VTGRQGDEAGDATVQDEERLSRNWHELLQELRVTQTGTQILTGFLLTLPFTQRFAELSTRQEVTYLVTMVGSVVTTGLIIAPVAFHRMLFRQRQRPWLVAAADVFAKIGLLLLAVTTSGVILLVFDMVVSWSAALTAAIATFVGLLVVWAGTPWLAPRNGSASIGQTAPRDE
jgi:fatty acid desaturase